MISPFERMYAKPNTNTASRITDAVSARSTIDLSARHAFNERISIGIILVPCILIGISLLGLVYLVWDRLQAVSGLLSLAHDMSGRIRR